MFPNMQAHIPDGNEEEPTSDAVDDFAEELTSQREGAEHGRAAETPLANLVSRRVAHPAPPPLPRMRQWTPWTSAVSWCERMYRL